MRSTTIEPGTVGPSPASDRVDNTLLREAFEASGLTATVIARRLDWTYTDKRGYVFGDSTRVKRVLGVVQSRGGRPGDRGRQQKTINITVAGLIADAIGAEPYEVGL